MGFRHYILNESKSHLSQKMGDILAATQALSEDAPQLGNRQLIRAAQGIVNQIRRILHDSWPDETLTTLKMLQKVGVALMRAIDSNADMRATLASAVQVMEKGSDHLKEPINNIGSPAE